MQPQFVVIDESLLDIPFQYCWYSSGKIRIDFDDYDTLKEIFTEHEDWWVWNTQFETKIKPGFRLVRVQENGMLTLSKL